MSNQKTDKQLWKMTFIPNDWRYFISNSLRWRDSNGFSESKCLSCELVCFSCFVLLLYVTKFLLWHKQTCIETALRYLENVTKEWTFKILPLFFGVGWFICRNPLQHWVRVRYTQRSKRPYQLDSFLFFKFAASLTSFKKSFWVLGGSIPSQRSP